MHSQIYRRPGCVAGGAASSQLSKRAVGPGTAGLEIAELSLAHKHFESAYPFPSRSRRDRRRTHRIGPRYDRLRLTREQWPGIPGFDCGSARDSCLSPTKQLRLLSIDPRNAEVDLTFYLNGQDLSSKPDRSPSRSVIFLRDWVSRPLAPMAHHSLSWRMISDRRGRGTSTMNSESYGGASSAPESPYMRPHDRSGRVLVKAQVVSTWGWVLIPTSQMLNARPIVFAFGTRQTTGSCKLRSPRMDVAIHNHTENRRHIHADDVL